MAKIENSETFCFLFLSFSSIINWHLECKDTWCADKIYENIDDNMENQQKYFLKSLIIYDHVVNNQSELEDLEFISTSSIYQLLEYTNYLCTGKFIPFFNNMDRIYKTNEPFLGK